MIGTYQELFLFFLGRLVVEPTGLDDLVVDVKFVPCTRKHSFFDALLGDESEDTDNLRLADTMRTVLRLQIGVRVPVGVEA